MVLRRMKENKRGFTLAELLVVVAIIAILVAVSIPIFTGKLEEARENTDLANERAAKAAAIAEFMTTENLTSYKKAYDIENGTMIDAEQPGWPNRIKGYNQTDKFSRGRNIAVVVVSIDVSSDEEEKPHIKVEWFDLKKY